VAFLILHFSYLVYNYVLDKNKFWLHFDTISYILCIHVLSSKNEKTSVQDTFSKFIIFKAKNTFEPKTPKCVENMNCTNFKLCCAFNDHYEDPL